MTEEAVSNTLPIGSLLHWYEVQDILGRGGYGITYLAFDRNLHRNVAIKEYLPSDFAHRVNGNTVHPMTDGHGNLYDWGLERFLSEARTLAQFSHKAIIKVNSVFEQNNTAYMVMEYEEGDDLAVAFEKRKPFTQEQLLKLFLPITEGLALVHDAGFIHRDIKPANIYVRHDGSPVLLDFGSARQTLKSQTTALTTLVTTGYAPFEQYNQSDDEQGVWTDIYALGSTLYYCITGDKPVDALKRSAGLIKQGRDVYEPISSVQIPGFTQNFLRAIDHALMFHPERRPHSVRYWADMLTGKMGVAPVTEDLFRINHPSDTYYDLDSTVVMTPVKAVPLDEQTVVRTQSETRYSSEANHSFRPQIDSPSAFSVAEQTIAQKLDDTPNQRYEYQSFRSAYDGPPIQPATSQQLDKITEALARPDIQPSSPIQSHEHRPTGKISAADNLQRLFTQSHVQLRKWIEELQHRLPKHIPNQLLHFHQNRALLFSALTVVLLLAVAILISVVFQDVDTESPRIAAQSDATVTNVVAATTESISIEPVKNNKRDLETVTNDIGPIAQLLQQARLEQVQGELIEEEGGGAYYKYRKILKLEPQHQKALQELEAIKQYYSNLLAANIQNNDWQQAQSNFAKFKIASDDQTQINYFERQFTQRETKLKNINNLLTRADNLFAQNKLTRPESNNALALYNEVLTIDSDNQAAKLGVNNIVDKLGDYLQQQLTLEQVKTAEITYNKIAEINSDAPVLANTEPVLAKLLAQRSEIFRLLRQAKADFIRGNIITPGDDNALDKYRAVIDIDPNHAKARQGIETIYQYYLSDFNHYIEEKTYDRADTILSKMISANFDRKRIEKLQQRLAKERVAVNN
ncbi:MAG: serine/threonine-protein kinase [Gammaproteobacteria bacterium]